MTKHSKSCNNGCIRKMNIRKTGSGVFAYYKGTLDCPAQVEPKSCEFEAITLCGCCSFENERDIKTIENCRFRKGDGNWADCECHNTMIIYTTCLSKRNHGACPYGFKPTSQEME
jgi:hypothetical protein